MAETDEFLVYLHEFRGQVAADLASYNSGTYKTGKIVDGDQVDTTAETIAELNRRHAKITKIIAAYRERKSAARS